MLSKKNKIIAEVEIFSRGLHWGKEHKYYGKNGMGNILIFAIYEQQTK